MKRASPDRLSPADRRVFRDFVREARSALNLTNEQIAKGIGRDLRTVTHALEKDDTRPLREPLARAIYDFISTTYGRGRAIHDLLSAMNDRRALIGMQNLAAFRRAMNAQQQKIEDLRRKVDVEHRVAVALAEFEFRAEWVREKPEPAVLILSDEVNHFVETLMREINVGPTAAREVRRGLLKGLGAKQRSRMARSWYDRVVSIAERLLDKPIAEAWPWLWQGERAGFIARDIMALSTSITLATTPDDPFPTSPPNTTHPTKPR